MATPHLIAVSTPTAGLADAAETRGRAAETGAERIRRLQQEARALAREEVEAFVADLTAVARHAEEIVAGGDAYPVGVRELATRIAEEMIQKAQAITSIVGRIA